MEMTKTSSILDIELANLCLTSGVIHPMSLSISAIIGAYLGYNWGIFRPMDPQEQRMALVCILKSFLFFKCFQTYEQS